jgi:multiple sugar transport system ATP-binding protein
MKVRGVSKAQQQEQLHKVAKQLQIEQLLDRKPGQLSGGQRQRVAMGRALVRDPKLFLFDEPLSNLDAKLRVEMRTEIKALHQRLGASMVYVTHDQIEAMTLATKIVVMKGGVIQQIGTPAEIYNTPANMFVADFMGSPAMNLIPARTKADGSGTHIEITRDNGAPIVLTETRNLSLPPEVMLGIRPEDIVEPSLYKGGSNQLQDAECLIDIVEPAGADTFAVTELGGKPVTARLMAETKATAREPLQLAFDLNKVSYFAPDSGLRLN